MSSLHSLTLPTSASVLKLPCLFSCSDMFCTLFWPVFRIWWTLCTSMNWISAGELFWPKLNKYGLLNLWTKNWCWVNKEMLPERQWEIISAWPCWSAWPFLWKQVQSRPCLITKYTSLCTEAYKQSILWPLPPFFITAQTLPSVLWPLELIKHWFWPDLTDPCPTPHLHQSNHQQ